VDTAGRTTLDEEMMTEAAIKLLNPHEVPLVADSPGWTPSIRAPFDQRVGLTGIVPTRVDGDGRGGAPSMRAVTGKPIKLIGTGEKTDALEDFTRAASPAASLRAMVSLVGGRRRISTPRVRHRRADAASSTNDMREQCCRWPWAASAA
jgi:signal recognition particle subunit SRP54